jgi:hypothetical protein
MVVLGWEGGRQDLELKFSAIFFTTMSAGSNLDGTIHYALSLALHLSGSLDMASICRGNNTAI